MPLKIKTISYESRAKIFVALSSVAALSLGLYIYSVLATIHHTVARGHLMKESADLLARVSELEFKDIALRNTVNLDTALARGMTEVKNPIYISRTRTSLTLNTR